jgi:hypothetical protein
MDLMDDARSASGSGTPEPELDDFILSLSDDEALLLSLNPNRFWAAYDGRRTHGE